MRDALEELENRQQAMLEDGIVFRRNDLDLNAALAAMADKAA